MQLQGHVADRVSKIEPDGAAALSRSRRDFLDVEQLTGEEIYPANEHNCDLIAMLFKISLNIILPHHEFSLARSRENQRLFRIETVMDDLRFDRIRIGREGRLFHQ